MPAVATKSKGAKAVKTKMVDGRMVSAKSKTGDPACSQAMSVWVRARYSGAAVAAEVFKILGKCRAKARQNSKASQQQASGKLAEGRGTWQRSERAAQLLGQRGARPASSSTSPAAQVSAAPATRSQMSEKRRARFERGISAAGPLGSAATTKLTPEQILSRKAASRMRISGMAAHVSDSQSTNSSYAYGGKITKHGGQTTELSVRVSDHKKPWDSRRKHKENLIDVAATKRGEKVVAEKIPIANRTLLGRPVTIPAPAPKPAARKAPAKGPVGGSDIAKSTTTDHPTGKAFADRVAATAATVGPSGRFGDNKVFISDAHAAYEAQHGKIPLADFKARLTEANQQRHLDLVRADLVEAMDPKQVAASKVEHFGATFNFVRAAPVKGEGKSFSPATTAPSAPTAKVDVSGHRAKLAEALKGSPRDQLDRLHTLRGEVYTATRAAGGSTPETQALHGEIQRHMDRIDRQLGMKPSTPAQRVGGIKAGQAGFRERLAGKVAAAGPEAVILRMVKPDGTFTRGGDVVRSHLAKLDEPALDRLKQAVDNEPNVVKRSGMNRWLGGEIAGERRARERAKPAAPSSTDKPFNLQNFREPKRFESSGKGTTGKLFDEMRGAGARDLPGQSTLFGGDSKVVHKLSGAKTERADLRAVPKGTTAAQLADQLWKKGQKQQAKGDPAAAETFARHDQAMRGVAHKADRAGAASLLARARARVTAKGAEPAKEAAEKLRGLHSGQGDTLDRAIETRAAELDPPTTAKKSTISGSGNLWRMRVERAKEAAAKAGDRLDKSMSRVDEAMARSQAATEARKAAEGPITRAKREHEEAKSSTTAPSAPAEPNTGAAEWRALIERSKAKGTPSRDRKATRLKNQRKELAEARASSVKNMDTKSIEFDPDRFQYKLDASGAHGTTGNLHGVKKWDPELGGVLQVWKDPGNGKTYVVNGHHRLDLAKRLGAEKVSVRYIKAANEQEARAKGALTNIAEGRGTSTDAAQFFRDSGHTRERLESEGVSLREKTATEGLALAGLEEGLWRRHKNGDLPTERAAIIGGSGATHAEQKTIGEQLDKWGSKAPPNKVLARLIEDSKAAPTVTKKTRSLFGDDEEEVNLGLHKAGVSTAVEEALSREKRLFGTVAKSRNASDLERAGNQINAEESGKLSEEAKENLAVYRIVRKSAGPVAALENEAAERLHRGETRTVVYADVIKRLPAAVAAMQRL